MTRSLEWLSLNVYVVNDSGMKYHLEQICDLLLGKGGMRIDGRCERAFERGALLEGEQNAEFCVTHFANENLLILFV